MKTDWKDDIFEERKIQLRDNGDGTVTPVDKTIYTQPGDSFGAKELNEIGEEINATKAVANNLKDVELPALKKSVSDGKTLMAAAITAKKVAAAATDTFAQLAAKIGQIVLGSGSATPPDVAAGKTFTNSSGVEQAGTMPNRGNISHSLPINGTYTIEAGQHGGGGKVTQDIPTLGAQMLYPGATAKTLSSTGKYMTGNVIVPAVSIAAAYIKKGQVITFPDGSTVTGTWEGYVAAATDIYNRGAWGNLGGGGFNAVGSVTSGQPTITIFSNMIRLTPYFASVLVTKSQINMTGYTKITAEVASAGIISGRTVWCGLYTSISHSDGSLSYPNTTTYSHRLAQGFSSPSTNNDGTVTTVTFNFSNVNANCYIAIGYYTSSANTTHQLDFYRVGIS